MESSRPLRLPEPLPSIRSLELLLLARHHGSVSRAAAVAGMAQPSASARLRSLEDALGVQLLRRSPAGVTLTDEGAVVADAAATVLTAMTSLVGIAATLRPPAETALRIAASYTIGEYLLPRWLASFRSARRRVAVELEVTNSMEVIDRLRDGACELGFVEGLAVPRDLHHHTITTDALVLVVAPTHRWARTERPLTPHAVAAESIVARERGSGTRDVWEQWLIDTGCNVESPVLELGSTSAVKAAVLAGSGAAVLSDLAVIDELRDGRLVAVEVVGLPLERPLRAAWPGPREVKGQALALLDHVRSRPTVLN